MIFQVTNTELLREKQFAARVSRNLEWSNSDDSDDGGDSLQVDDTQYLVRKVIFKEHIFHTHAIQTHIDHFLSVC